MNIAIITGASSGIGREFAYQLRNVKQLQIDELWLIARRKERLEALADAINIPTRILSMNLTEDEMIQSFQDILEQEKPSIQLLINCAGFGLLGKFRELDLNEQLGMIDVNCKALTKITYFCIPYMARKSHIIQMASSAAFLPQPNFAIYAATKSYVLSLSYALGEELRKEEISVTAVCPGPVKTEFFATAEKYGSNMAVKQLTSVEAPGVVRAALKATYHRKTISVYSPFIKLFHLMTKIVPLKWILIILRTIK